MELSKVEEELLSESHRPSPKAKVVKSAAARRRKRSLAHGLRGLDEALSPVTTPTDDDVIHRIKQVAGSTQTRRQSPQHLQQHHHHHPHFPHLLPSGLAFYSVSKLLVVISFV